MIRFIELFNKNRTHRSIEQIAHDANIHNKTKMKNEIKTALTGVGIFIGTVLALWMVSGVFNAFAESSTPGAGKEVERLQQALEAENIKHEEIIKAENERHDNLTCNLVSALAGAKLLGDADGSYKLPEGTDRDELAAKRDADCPLS